MKGVLKLFVPLLISLFLSSCSAISGIFKAGMGFGIFIVIDHVFITDYGPVISFFIGLKDYALAVYINNKPVGISCYL